MTSPLLMIESLKNQFLSNQNNQTLENLKSMVYSLSTIPPTNLKPNPDEFNMASKL